MEENDKITERILKLSNVNIMTWNKIGNNKTQAKQIIKTDSFVNKSKLK